MSHPTNDLILEDKRERKTDWMQEKKTELDLWLEDKGLSLTDVFIEKGQYYVILKGHRTDVPQKLTLLEEDYPPEI